ncbi:M12 family metallopeptidase [Sphaerisporangium sp. TRM90804]|uniref:M12 family metallopeptidase n=1 Tax=Sphaerisporangium sp. TRM90804 TaxID=3031113 RepID=UPI00244B4148|nr:M12 family metallopeptidase [Sphaerisporangium sp. TRM90804]MDH2427358.1 M12 family metallopeptidase [Sphaerisporangium sp. TRM90804]
MSMTYDGEHTRYCELAAQSVLTPADGLGGRRLAALVSGRLKWLNGTVLHYYFFDRETDGSMVQISDGPSRFVSWVGDEAQREAVRQAFRQWKEVGIGLEFTEVADRDEAEIRIGFMRGDGSWSYLGRDALGIPTGERTVNFGWPLTTAHGRATALHELGHVLGMPHEHQSPFAGIVWDEEAVYRELAGPPNMWSRQKTFHNIIRKLDPAEVDGSPWDFQSIMEYEFGEGMILEPEEFRKGLVPPGTLSRLDAEFARRWYPATGPAGPVRLSAFTSVPLDLGPGEQADHLIVPEGTRDYTVATFGQSDTVLGLFEEIDGEPRFMEADDDGGRPRNSSVTAHLVKGRRYVVRVRLYSARGSGQAALMYW